MTRVGMDYDEWRAQYGNPLGLTHDKATRSLMVKHIHSVAAEGMRGVGAGAATNHPKVPIKTLPKVGDVNLKLSNNLELAALYYGAPEEEYWVTHEGDRSPQLSYYYRNRDKVRAYQKRYKDRLRAQGVKV